jgi:hypothetical protein
MVQACPHKWSHWLPLAEFWYNTTFHSALGMSPFQVLYGYPPRHFGLKQGTIPVGEEVKEWVEERNQMNTVIKDHLHRA